VCLSRTGSKRYMSTQVFFGVKIDEQRIYIWQTKNYMTNMTTYTNPFMWHEINP
jgi:hypothetical protein